MRGYNGVWRVNGKTAFATSYTVYIASWSLDSTLFLVGGYAMPSGDTKASSSF